MKKLWEILGLLLVTSFGLLLVHCSENTKECATAADCKIKGEGFFCDPVNGICKCVPVCVGKCGGDNGCGGVCSDNCGEGQRCNTDTNVCETMCSDGARRCTGSILQICMDGVWTDGADCAVSKQICQDGHCKSGQVCKDGDIRCSGSVVQNCSSGNWESGIDCASYDQVCIDGLCKPAGCLELGEQCTDSSQCCGSWCLKYTGQDKGYCTKRDCQGDDSCVNHSTDNAEMCCVDVGDEYFICLKIGEGYTCGDSTGMCGSSCAGQMDSACDPSQACLSAGLDDPNAVCAHECTTDNECSDCSDPNSDNITFSCQSISGGVTYCLKDKNSSCDSSFACDDGYVCVAWPSDDQQSLDGKCSNLGDLPPGSACNEDLDPNNLPAEERCSDFYCIKGHCSEVCSVDNDCPENMLCSTINFHLGSDGTIASIGMCTWMDGSGISCGSNTDCPNGEICSYYLPPDGSVKKICTSELCDPESFDCAGPGDECGAGLPDCFTGLCLTSQNVSNSWCSLLCDNHSDCPTGMACGLLGISETETTGACVPFDGSAQSCGRDADCPDGETCKYIASPAGGMESVCATMSCDPAYDSCSFVGETCGQDSNPCYNELCLTNGTDSWCGAVCETEEDCPNGFTCGDLQFNGDPALYGACVPT